MSMYDLHRLSCDRLRQELAQVGFNSLRTGDLERILYPHFLSHSIGIGMLIYALNGLGLLMCCPDLHETSNFDRGARYDFRAGLDGKNLNEDMQIAERNGVNH